MKFTGERYLPGEKGEIRLEHMHRYAVAMTLATGKDVLDVACGEGYGSRLLSSMARSVTGVDISAEAIDHARRTYGHFGDLQFKEGSATKLPLADRSVDLAVSFETIEHLDAQREMLAELRRVLRPDGVLVLSSPNRPVYSRLGEKPNEFHVRELDFRELDDLLREHFPAVRYFGQRFAAGSVLQPLDGWGSSYTAWCDDGTVASPKWAPLSEPVYFVAVCASQESQVPRLEASFLQSSSEDILESYRNMARWARQVDEEVERGRELYRKLDDEHRNVASWAQSLEAELGRAREELRELKGEPRNGSADSQSPRPAAAPSRAIAEPLEAALERADREKERLEEACRLALERSAGFEAAAGQAQGTCRILEQELRMANARGQELSERLEAARSESDTLQRQHEELRIRQEALDREFAQLRTAMVDMEMEYKALAEAQAPLEAAVTAFRTSLSWRITYPIRVVAGIGFWLASFVEPRLRAAAQRAGTAIFHALPFSPFERARMRAYVYRRWPRFANGSPLYEAWKEWQPWLGILNPALVKQSQGEGAMLVPGDDRMRTPKVSVIVPVYGQLAYTLRCIQGLIEVQTAVPFEIVVVDDCSPDMSVEVLSGVPAIRLVGNRKNEGFIRTCNRGAAAARGEFVVFLNNDTIVQPGWLNNLLRTFEDFPECGLAGSQLLYPDGRLQEAGGILWNDGSGWNYGRLDDPARPEYSYVRDVDYCSGASIMLRTELFRRLGGFDERYAPAYCEDSDLAFRVRRAGYRVLYQPFSRVVHFEGVTSGTDVTQGVKAHQVANARKLHERWKDTLKDHGEPGRDPHLVRDRNIAGRVLVIDHCTPTPDQDAGSITALNLMRIFAQSGMKVTFIPEDNMLFMDRYTPALQSLGIECLYGPHVANLRAHLVEFGHIYDVVVFFRVGNATRHLDELELYCPNARIVYHTSDLHFLRFERQAEVENSPELRHDAAVIKERELETVRRTHATIVHSTHEKRLLEDLLGWADDSRIFVLGWSIPIPGTQKGFAGRDGMVFVGGFQHGPNVDGVEWFVSEVFPRIRERLPSARFSIVGSKAPEHIRELNVPGVEYLGHVADLAPLMDTCRLSVAPLRFGAGTKGKVYTSLSHGLPCVSTSVGAEGMGLEHGRNVLVADSAEAFAEQVVRLHEDEALWQDLSRNGFAYLEDHASLDVGRKVVGKILERLGLSDRPRLALVSPPAGLMPREVLVADRAQFDAFMASDLAARQSRFEEKTARKHSGTQEWYDLEGWCEVCERPRAFRVDKVWGGRPLDGQFWIPNWRERCVCHGCHLNTRQRAIAARVRDRVRAGMTGGRSFDVYLTEQVTPIFGWLRSAVPDARWMGSEYLGPDAERGGVNAEGIRHEDVEKLTFDDASFDLVVSNDVLEHVPDPLAGLGEILRVLKPGGTLLMTVPFHTDLEQNRRRAELENGKLVHHLPPEYHGNPVSEEGSLVFTDFGWELLGQMRGIGYDEVALHLYWSEWNAYLGVGQHYLRAVRRA